MFAKMKRVAAGLAAISLAVVGLAGCSDGAEESSDTESGEAGAVKVEEEEVAADLSDKEACVLFSDGFGLMEEGDDTEDPVEHVKGVATSLDAAADAAETPTLAENMRVVSTALQELIENEGISDEWNEELEEQLADMVIALMRVAEACEAEGTPIRGYDTLMEDSGFEGMSADDLEELLEMYKESQE